MKLADLKYNQALRCMALQLMAAFVLAGCGGGGGTTRVDTPALGPGPVQLGANRQQQAPATGQGQSVIRPLDEAKVRRGIEVYAINKKRTVGPYRLVGADLNEDGIPEAMVLFQGKDWCARNGCSLAILRSDTHGYRAISRTVRVKPPVVISGERTNGWRDLFVSTGGDGSAPLRRVRLRFTSNSYARNAMLEEEMPPDVPQFGETAFPAAPAGNVRSSTSTAR